MSATVNALTIGEATEMTQTGGSRYEAALRVIGDLDHPHYQDERQRFVWYEASAIGFQLLLLLNLAMVGIVLLVMGQSAYWSMFAIIIPTGIAAVVTAAYTKKRGAYYSPQSSDFKRARGVIGVAVGLLYLAGFVRVAIGNWEGELTFAAIAGMLTGFVVVGAIIGGAFWLAARASRRNLDAVDELD